MYPFVHQVVKLLDLAVEGVAVDEQKISACGAYPLLVSVRTETVSELLWPKLVTVLGVSTWREDAVCNIMHYPSA